MLLRNVVFLVDIALQRRKNALLLEKVFATLALEIQHALVGNSIRVCGRISALGRDGEVFQLLS